MTDWVDGDVIRVSSKLTTATGEDIVNVFHFRYVGDPLPEGSCQIIIAFAIDGMFTNIQPEIPSDVAFTNIDMANVTQGLVYGPVPWPVLTTGGGTGDTMPEQCCALVLGSTNQPHTIGRKFLGPFIEAANADGTWYGTLLGMLSDFADDYADDIVAGVGSYLVPVLVSYLLGAPVRVTDILGTSTSNQIYTQRRRRRGVGA